MASRTHHPESEVRLRVLQLLRRFGYAANSFQVLQCQFEYWFSDENACVAYVDTGRAWVAAGAPIAAPQHLRRVALEFAARGKSLGRRVAFFGTESRMSDLTELGSVMVGLQPSFSTCDWTSRISTRRTLRRQLHRAQSKGVRIERLELPNAGRSSFDTSQPELEALTQRWLASKPLPPLGFLTSVQPFSFASERRYFVARNDSGVVGAAVMVPIYARQGWLLENLMRAPGAPNGTVESLIDAAIRAARGFGADFVTLGLTPLAGNVTGYLRVAKHVTSWLYDFVGLEHFRAKLQPNNWSPVYITFPNTHTAALAVYDSLVAFARGSLVRFGLQALLKTAAPSGIAPKAQAPFLRHPPEPLASSPGTTLA